jgi:hypothetical protein
MLSQYYKFVPVAICISVLLFLAFGESYISMHSKDSSVMTMVSERRTQLMGLFAVLTGVTYYYFCYKKPVISLETKLPSYMESMSAPDSVSTSVTSN